MELGEALSSEGEGGFGEFGFDDDCLPGASVDDRGEVNDHMREKPAGGVLHGFFDTFLAEKEEFGHFARGLVEGNARGEFFGRGFAGGDSGEVFPGEVVEFFRDGFESEGD